jgi:hypothetical protein
MVIIHGTLISHRGADQVFNRKKNRKYYPVSILLNARVGEAPQHNFAYGKDPHSENAAFFESP